MSNSHDKLLSRVSASWMFGWPLKSWGETERRKARLGICAAAGSRSERRLRKRLSTLHSRRFWAQGPCFRGRSRATRPLHPADFAAFDLSASSHRVAEPRSRPGRWPRPPGRAGANRNAQAPHLAPPRERLMMRPSRTRPANYTRGSDSGDKL